MNLSAHLPAGQLDKLSNELHHQEEEQRAKAAANTPLLVVKTYNRSKKFRQHMAQAVMICRERAVRGVNPLAEEAATQLLNLRRRMKVAGLCSDDVVWPASNLFRFPKRLEAVEEKKTVASVMKAEAARLTQKLSEESFCLVEARGLEVLDVITSFPGNHFRMNWKVDQELHQEVGAENLVMVEVYYHHHTESSVPVTYGLYRPKLVTSKHETVRDIELLEKGEGLPFLAYIPRRLAGKLGSQLDFPYIDRLDASGDFLRDLTMCFARMSDRHVHGVGAAGMLSKVMEAHLTEHGALIERVTELAVKFGAKGNERPLHRHDMVRILSDNKTARLIAQRFMRTVIELQEIMADTPETRDAAEIWCLLAFLGQPEVAELEPNYQPWIRTCAGVNAWNDTVNGMPVYRKGLIIDVESTEPVYAPPAVAEIEVLDTIPARRELVEEEIEVPTGCVNTAEAARRLGIEVPSLPLGEWHPAFFGSEDHQIPLSEMLRHQEERDAEHEDAPAVSEGLADVPQY